MRLIVAKDYADVSRKAANIIAAQVQLKPDCVLGLATGSSPVGTYQELIKKYENGELDFSQVKTVNLDEYVGLTKDHDQSYAYFMNVASFCVSLFILFLYFLLSSLLLFPLGFIFFFVPIIKAKVPLNV